jgi:hypothetical protein
VLSHHPDKARYSYGANYGGGVDGSLLGPRFQLQGEEAKWQATTQTCRTHKVERTGPDDGSQPSLEAYQGEMIIGYHPDKEPESVACDNAVVEPGRSE